MGNLFSGIQLALRSLMANQQAIEVTQHNVANVNTPGYHRQEAHLTTTYPYPPAAWNHGTGSGQLGTGVTVDQINRFNMDFFDARYRNESSDAEFWKSKGGVLQQLEATMSETGTDGLTAKLDAFWGGWQKLANDPTNSAARADLRQKAIDLTGAFNSRAETLTNMRQDQNATIVDRVSTVNQIAQQLAGLNGQIAEVKGFSDQPNDLMDQRDQLLEQLSKITGATASIESNGQALVSIDGHALVVGEKTNSLVVTPDATTPSLNQINWADGQSFRPASGELGGLFTARDTDIPNQLSGLNTLAAQVVNQVNVLHVAGFTGNNTTGVNFFDPAGTTALTLRVDGAILGDANNIAASGGVNQPGDGSVAAALAKLKDTAVFGGPPATKTLNQYYNDQVTNLGLDIRQANQNYGASQLVADSLSQQAQSVEGVSLDEEAANLVKYQRAYQASARIMNAVDDMLNTVINGMGRVGL